MSLRAVVYDLPESRHFNFYLFQDEPHRLAMFLQVVAQGTVGHLHAWHKHDLIPATWLREHQRTFEVACRARGLDRLTGLNEPELARHLTEVYPGWVQRGMEADPMTGWSLMRVERSLIHHLDSGEA